MIANENIRLQLVILLEKGLLPKSKCSDSLLRFLKPLFDSSVIIEERSGAGRRLVVRDEPALQSFFRLCFPDIAI
jgi:hypothetical protein